MYGSVLIDDESIFDELVLVLFLMIWLILSFGMGKTTIKFLIKLGICVARK